MGHSGKNVKKLVIPIDSGVTSTKKLKNYRVFLNFGTAFNALFMQLLLYSDNTLLVHVY